MGTFVIRLCYLFRRINKIVGNFKVIFKKRMFYLFEIIY